VEAQKIAYKNALEKQFQQALAKIESQREVTKQMLRHSAQQQKDQYSFQARSKLEATKLQLDEQLNTQLLMLQETAMKHTKMLEDKSAALTLDYQSRKANEDLQLRQIQLQTQFVDNERKLQEEFQRQQQESAAPAPTEATEKP